MKSPFHHLARGIFIHNNKILLVQANGFTNTFLPGGHVEFGESAKEALLREVEEELGIRCRVIRFLGVVEHKWEKEGILHCEINQVFMVNSDELCTSSSPKSRESHLSFFWCNVDDLDTKNLQPFPFKQLIKKLLSGNRDIWWESTLNSEIDDSNRN